MRQVLLLASALVCLGAPAGAVTYTVGLGAPDPGAAPGQSYVVTFDAPNAAGYSWTGGLQTATGSVQNVYAAPAGDATVFGYVSSAIDPNTATLDTPELKSISFYVGSVDTFNMLEVLDKWGNVLLTLNGPSFPADDGNQFDSNSNVRLFLTAAPGQAISGLRFTSTGVALEFDDFAASAVPEPASWAMMIAGFGLVGAVSRRRRAGTAHVLR